MPRSPQCKFYLYNKETPVQPASTLWRKPIPRKRNDFAGSGRRADGPAISLGMYFDAVHAFLASNGFKPLLKSVAPHVSHPVKLNEINTIDVVLEKHGEFYHPSCIAVDIHGQRVSLVMNVALAAPAREILHREYGIFLLHRPDQRHHPRQRHQHWIQGV